MNFDILPELHWDLGYMYFWLVALGIVTICVSALKYYKVI